MAYLDMLVSAAIDNTCPGCGPNQLSNIPPDSDDLRQKFCHCCGWLISFTTDGPETGSLIINPLNGSDFTCIFDHPEHKANWPKPEYDSDQPDQFTEEELAQDLTESDPAHYYLLRDEKCGNCGEWAPHKIAEERNDYQYHPYTSNLCCNCFEKIFGPKSHERYDKVYTKPQVGVNL